LAFASVAAWQGFVLIPSLRWASAPQALSPTALRAAARGEEQAVPIDRGQPLSALSLDINAAAPGAVLTYDLIAPGGAVRHSRETRVPKAGTPLIVLLPTDAIREPGDWVLRLRDRQGVEVARYPFSVQLN
jgi:hypothetical protein